MTVYGRPSSVSACPRIAGIAVETLLPERVADEDHGLAAGPVFGSPRSCGPSAGWSPSVGSSGGRGLEADELLGVAAAGPREGVEGRERQVAEHLLACCHVEVARMGEADAPELLRLVRRAQPDEPIGLVVRQWPQEHRIDDAEQRDVGADAEREADDRHRREPGRPDQLTDGEAKLGSHDDTPDRGGAWPRPLIVRRDRALGRSSGWTAGGPRPTVIASKPCPTFATVTRATS